MKNNLGDVVSLNVCSWILHRAQVLLLPAAVLKLTERRLFVVFDAFSQREVRNRNSFVSSPIVKVNVRHYVKNGILKTSI